MTSPVHRPRIADAVGSAPLVAITGHAGVGKTVAMEAAVVAHDGPVFRLDPSSEPRGSLGATIHRAVREQGHTALAEALSPTAGQRVTPDLLGARIDAAEAPLLLAIDNLHLVDDEWITDLVASAAAWTRPHRLLLAGRRLPDPVATAMARSDGRIIDAEELRLHPDEVAQLLGDVVAERLDAAEIQLLTGRHHGWPVAIARTARLLRAALELPGEGFQRAVSRSITRPSTVDEVVAEWLAAPSAARDHEALARLAGLPAFDDVLCREAGLAAGLAAIADHGLPLVADGEGWWSFVDPVCERLRRVDADPGWTRSAARHHLAIGRTDLALRALMVRGLEAELATTLADLPSRSIGQLDPSRHAAAVGAVPIELLEAHPRILIHLADSYIVAGRPEDYREAIRRAVDLLDARGDQQPRDHGLEVAAAELTMRAVVRDDDGLLEQAETLLADPRLSVMARARLLGGIGRATASGRTSAAFRTGARALERGAQLYEQEDAVTHAAAHLVVAATQANWPLGRYQVALEQLDRALRHTRSNLRARIAVLPYRAFILIDLGRYDEAHLDLAELRRSANASDTIGNERAAAFARWGAATIASQQGDAVATWAGVQAVARSEAAVDAGGGAYFRAAAAQLLARVGRFEDAERLLGEAQERAPGTSSRVELARFVVAVYAGDLGRAETSLARLGGGSLVEPRERWRVTLLHAYVRHLVGAPDVPSLAAGAFEEAAQLGHPDLPFIREPDVAQQLLAQGTSHSASARTLHDGGAPHVRVFGGLRVERDGTVIEPGGRPAELIAFLALHDRSVTVDHVIGVFWPEADTKRGRERLRTVLHRVRRECGDLVERRTDIIRLREDVRIDAEEFLSLARHARSSGQRREPAAAAALVIYTGSALPEFAGSGWSHPVRQQLEDHALVMHDVLAAAAESGGRLEEAIAVSEAATAIDGTAEHHYLAAARLLAEVGDQRRALLRLVRARAALEEAGVEPSPELRRLEAYLERGPR